MAGAETFIAWSFIPNIDGKASLARLYGTLNIFLQPGESAALLFWSKWIGPGQPSSGTLTAIRVMSTSPVILESSKHRLAESRRADARRIVTRNFGTFRPSAGEPI